MPESYWTNEPPSPATPEGPTITHLRSEPLAQADPLHDLLPLAGVCDETGRFRESRLDWSELFANSTPTWHSPPRPSPSVDDRLVDLEQKRRSNFEPLLEDIEETQAESPTESPTPQTPSSQTSSSAKSLNIYRSYADLRQRFIRSARTLVPKASKTSLRGDCRLQDPLSDPNVISPRTEFHLRGKHSLPAAKQSRCDTGDPEHPHHPFLWANENLWCAACAPFFRPSEVPKQAEKEPTLSIRGAELAVSPALLARRDTPLECVLCQTACCTHGSLQLALLQRASHTHSAYIDTASRTGMDLSELELSFVLGLDPPRFVTCMGDGCARSVCPGCASRCAEPLCGLVLCRSCWPAQGGECDLHMLLAEEQAIASGEAEADVFEGTEADTEVDSLVETEVDIVPPMPTRTPPPPPPSRTPPPPPPSRPPPPPPEWARCPQRRPLPPAPGPPPSIPLPPVPLFPPARSPLGDFIQREGYP